MDTLIPQIEHPLALLHHIRYLNTKTYICSSLMHDLS
jgi:hypothetical protein